MLLAFPYRLVPACWRRLYTDAVLVGVLAEIRLAGLRGGEGGMAAGAAEAVIRRLDLVLIVAGAPGEGREDVTHSLIHHIQNNYLTSIHDKSPPTKRRRLSPPASPSASSRPPHPPPPLPAPHVTHPIRRFASPPSLDQFIALLKNPKPFVVSGGCADWPAAERWEVGYLARQVGPARVVPVEAGGDYTKAGWGQQILPFKTFLDRLDALVGDGIPPPSHPTEDSPSLAGDATLPPASVPLYLAQHDLFRQFPSLLDDLIIPDYVYACPSAPPDAPDYAPPSTADGFLLNGWLGPAGTVSPAHTDPYFNLYAQVKGSKWVWTAPPGVAGYMAAYGEACEAGVQEGDPSASGEGGGGDDEDGGSDEDEAGGSAELMTNTARVDVTLPPTDAALRRRHPSFVARVAPVAQQTVLEAGDLLFLPPGWWHAMKSLSVSFSVSIWF